MFVRALAVSTMLTVVPVLILRFLDRREPEAPVMFAIALLWGGLIATGLALPFNNAILQAVANAVAVDPTISEFLGPDAPLLIGAPLAGPLVEEITKGLGVLVLFWLFRAEFDNLRDGFIYGALVGAGFNWLEAPLYVAQGYAAFGVAPFGFQLGARYAFFGLAGHALYTGMFGVPRPLPPDRDPLAPLGGALCGAAAGHQRALPQQRAGAGRHHRGPAERRTVARTGTAARGRPGHVLCHQHGTHPHPLLPVPAAHGHPHLHQRRLGATGDSHRVGRRNSGLRDARGIRRDPP
ncbi:MAG: PrsW family glutamic-type intramembrane protease [Caldilineaceae bacterium]